MEHVVLVFSKLQIINKIIVYIPTQIFYQLFNKLKNTTLFLNKKVTHIGENELTIENGEVIGFDKLILATDHRLILGNNTEEIKYNHCIQYYFKTDRPLLGKKIGLIADNEAGMLGIAAIGELKGVENPKF